VSFPSTTFLTRFFLLFGHSEFFVRLPSVIPGIASVLLLFRLLRRFTGFPGALYASAIFALNSLAILHSQEGRQYALALFLTIVSVYSFLGILEGATRGWLAVYFAITIPLSYNQILYLSVFAGQILVLGILYSRATAELRPRLRRLFLVQAAVIPLLTPLAVRAIFLFPSRATLYGWILKPDWPWIRYVLAWPEVSFASVLLPGAWVLWRSRHRLRPRSDAERALVWLGLLYTAIWPLALTLALLGIVNILVPRYLLPALLGVLFLVAFCLSKVGGVVLRATLGAYIVLLIYFHATALLTFGTWLQIIYKPSWREAGVWVDSHYRNGDVVLVRSGLSSVRI
jgi:uncharacterized membrane protein